MSDAGITHELPPLEENDLWPVRPRRGLRLPVPAAILLALVLAAAGFAAGTWLQKRHGGSGSASLASFVSSLRSARRGAGATTTRGGGRGGFGAFGGAGAAPAATGTISVVDGDVLWVLTGGGNLVKVTLDPSTTITRDASTKADGLRPGDSVVVQGQAAKGGQVRATSVTATGPGVSAGGAGGFGGGGGGFGRGGGGFGGNGAATRGGGNGGA